VNKIKIKIHKNNRTYRFSLFNINYQLVNLQANTIKNTIKFIGDLTSTKDWSISFYISGCKPHPMNWFYEIELYLKFTSYMVSESFKSLS